MKIADVPCPDFTATDLVRSHELISRWPAAGVADIARSLDPARCDTTHDS